MKKLLAIVLAAIMVMAFAACSANTGKDEKKPDSSVGDTIKADMSKYPANLDEWTGQNFVDYFKEVGVFSDGNGYETWIQDHATQWTGTPIDECAGWWDEAGNVCVMIMTLNTKNADSTEELLNEWKDYIKEHKSLNEDYSSLPIDHLVGNVAFSFETLILDDEIYNQMLAAYNNLIETMGVTPEF